MIIAHVIVINLKNLLLFGLSFMFRCKSNVWLENGGFVSCIGKYYVFLLLDWSTFLIVFNWNHGRFINENLFNFVFCMCVSVYFINAVCDVWCGSGWLKYKCNFDYSLMHFLLTYSHHTKPQREFFLFVCYKFIQKKILNGKFAEPENRI